MTETLLAGRWLLRRGRTGLLALLVGIALFELIQPVAIASFGDLDRMERLLGFVPPAFFALMNVTPDFLANAGLAGYLALGFSHPVYHILAAATVVWFTARGLAGEMERGTIMLALSRPLSRPRLYAARVGALVVVCVAVAIVGPLGMIAGVAIADPDGTVRYAHFAPLGVASLLLLWCIGGVSLAASAAADRMGQAVGWAIGGLVVSYVVDYFAALWTALEPIQPLSVFAYYDPASALARGTIAATDTLVLGFVGLGGVVAGLVVFVRRDLPT